MKYVLYVLALAMTLFTLSVTKASAARDCTHAYRITIFEKTMAEFSRKGQFNTLRPVDLFFISARNEVYKVTIPANGVGPRHLNVCKEDLAVLPKGEEHTLAIWWSEAKTPMHYPYYRNWRDNSWFRDGTILHSLQPYLRPLPGAGV